VAFGAVGLVGDAAGLLDRVGAGVVAGDREALGVGVAGAQAAEVVGGAEDDVGDVARVDGGVLVGVAVDLPLLPGAREELGHREGARGRVDGGVVKAAFDLEDGGQ
jgi:hypothetical protein